MAVKQRTWLMILVMVLVLLAGAPVAPAAETSPEDPYYLSLNDALAGALENNLDFVLSRKDPEIAEQSVEVQAAEFDPTLTATPTYRKSVDEPFNPSNVNESESLAVSTTWSEKLKFGADYSVDFSASKFDASAPIFRIDSAYSSSVTLGLNVPLLRGRGREATTEALVIARSNLEMSREDLRREAHETLRTVEGAYWELAAARRNLEVSRQSLDRAQDFLDLTQKKVDVGTLAPIEITQAEAEVARQEELLIVAETNLENAEDNLRYLLGIPPDDPIWGRRIVPEDQPTFKHRPIELGAAIGEALKARPELVNARQELRNQELSERAAKNRTRHGLNLRTSVTPSGNNFRQDPGPDGIPNTFDDLSVVDGALSEALQEMPEFENYDWSVSVDYSIPIRNRAAKANHRIATLNREKAEVSLRNLERSIRVDVRAAVRAVESGLKRVDAARASVVLERKKLEAEQKKFENGMSTSFEVLEFQNDLASAELTEVNAIIDYNKALVDFERARGTLLEARGLTLE
jgi:outer membrane protein TolC